MTRQLLPPARILGAAALFFALLVVAGCGGGARPEGPRGARGQPIARPLEIYHQLGFLAGTPDFPAVARLATLAGPADSTFLLVGLSMPNSALRFQRDLSGFFAEYRITAVVLRDTQQVKQLERRETVRVPSFAETGRTEESVVFQDLITLAPGNYTVRVHANDLNSSRGFSALDTVNVPAYPRERRMAPPLLVYQAAGRNATDDRPEIIINPRNTVPYGGEAPRVYLELYGAATPDSVAMRVVDESGTTLWSTQTRLDQGDAELRHALIDVPSASLPLGQLWLEASAAADTTQRLRTPLLIAISDQWMVANFEEVLQFLHYIAYPAELDSLREVTGPERRERWDRFWARRDPLPVTPLNEFRESFFQRVRYATEQFAESGRPGWQTDRGEVYIVLGPPDHAIERHVGTDISARPNFVEWLYESIPGGRLVLQFIDRSGFGRFEMTSASEAAFRSAAHRLRHRGD